MPVYVDPVMSYGGSKSFPWPRSCHMFADTLDELHELAAKIGMKRSWFQDKRLPHYDLTESKSRLARRMGAIQLDRRQAYDKWAELGFVKPKPPAEPSPGEQLSLF